MEKVFKEKGLVTRSSNARFCSGGAQGRAVGHRLCRVCCSLSADLAGRSSLKENMRAERDFWATASESAGWKKEDVPYWMPLVYQDVNGRPVYGGATPLTVAARRSPSVPITENCGARGPALADSDVFLINDQLVRFARDEDSIQDMRRASLRVLFESSVLRPLLAACVEKWAVKRPKPGRRTPPTRWSN
jgi:hypothetical protein